ncbi:hypothetical protein CCMSSC00406_0004794 [Pleurotus cornucopiae]|uniref:Uncharacterized protein n=1 Tax=Pleurotus cornucopiae TaxID=5321 RepID=A0ACB7J2R9_PLECO|nr:hypothetical protein CCMSSC00406_0004794 [Pleurotus cornucopiae]
MKPNHALTFCSALLYLCKRIDAVLINTTIDDTLGDPTTGRFIAYHPVSAWNDGANCDRCNAHPDTNFLYMRTWKDSTYDPKLEVPSASVSFTGTAVYVLCALSHSKARPFGSSNMTFFIDDRLAGNFTQEAPGAAGFDYNVAVFVQTNLPSTEHNLTIQNGYVDGPRTLMLLDAIIYTQDNGKSEPSSISMGPKVGPTATTRASTESSSTPGSVIIAAVIGSTGGVALIILLYLLCHRHRSHRTSSTQTSVTASGGRSPPSQPYITTPFVYEGPPSSAVAPSSVHEEEAPPPYGYPQGKT